MRKLIFLTCIIAGMLVSCDSDDDEGFVVVVKEDGTTSNGSVFLLIDDKNFYLDDVKYTVNFNGNLEVTGYDEGRFNGIANIVPKIAFKGNTYNVTCIDMDAFKNCSILTSVTIPSTVREIGEYAFYNCSGLTSLFIPKNVSFILEFAFSGCSGLKQISVEEGNEKYYSPNNCNAILQKKNNLLILGCVNTIFPDNTWWIYIDAFRDCSDLTTITIPNSVASIDQSAFQGCSGLTSVTIPNSVFQIGYRSFAGCSGLTSITIPNSVETIAEDAFSECSSLTSVHCQIETPKFSPWSFFDEKICSSATLYVPKGSLDAYKGTSPWNKFNNIVEE